MERFCVALPLPQPLGGRLDVARGLLQPHRRHMPAHVTVVPPVSLDGSDARAAAALIQRLALDEPPISVHLRGASTFAPRSSTAFLGLASGSPQIGDMAERLGTAPFPAPRRPFHPHVTITSRAPSTLVRAAIEAFSDFAADCVLDTLTLYVLTDEGWRPFSEGRMGGSRP